MSKLLSVAYQRTITSQIILQKFEVHHASDLFTLIDSNREYLKQWLSWVDNVKEMQNSLNFINQVNSEIQQNKFLTFGIFFKGKLVGVISFNKIDWASQQANIGYWLGENFQGKGIITLACQQLIEIGFKELGLRRININCAVGNLRSQAVPKRLGFIKGDIIKNHELINGKKLDHIIYFCDHKT